MDQSCLAPVSPHQEWFGIPLFNSPKLRGPLSVVGSDSSEDTSDVNELETSRKRQRSESDNEECERERKVGRSSKACKECRKAKAKCVRAHQKDETSPCMRCSTMGKECVFVEAGPRRDPNRRFAALQKQLERMEEMHRLLQEALLHQSKIRHYSPPTQQGVRL
ncbi:hypothetical protein FRC06_011768 [Ceratobasidium sp. 370]|nr:hypothetical protein FRC06_011768 [Ceratobasidium sp. 370]